MLFHTSKKIESEARGRKAYEINTRTCISFREIGRGYNHLQTFCRAMNIPPPMNANVFNAINNNLYEAYTSVAEDSMLNAAKEIPINEDIDRIKVITASFDGS